MVVKIYQRNNDFNSHWLFKLIIRYLCIYMPIIISACNGGKNQEQVEPFPGNQLMGSWVNQESEDDSREVFVLLPDGTFEGENITSPASGIWTLTEDSLFINNTIDTESVHYFWSLDSDQLLLSENGQITRLMRRSYGLNSNLIIDRMNRITRLINQKLLNQKESIVEFNVPGESGGVRILGLWEEGGIPEKLAVTEPVSNEFEFGGFSEFYFLNGFPVFYVGKSESIAFEGNQITGVWVSEDFMQDISESDLNDKYNSLLNSLRQYLEAFGFTEESGQFNKNESQEEPEPTS